MEVTVDLLKKISKAKPDNLPAIAAGLTEACKKFDINTPSRMACFLAQTAHESGGYSLMKENLNYSANGLSTVFKKYFTPDQALAYQRQPEKIANRVYANRMGNGDEASGDGYKHRGRGWIQLTGANNYKAFASAIGKTVDEAIAYLETFEGASMSAAWFWSTNNLNVLADKEDMVTLTKRINGGTIGLEDRIHHFKLIRPLL